MTSFWFTDSRHTILDAFTEVSLIASIKIQAYYVSISTVPSDGTNIDNCVPFTYNRYSSWVLASLQYSLPKWPNTPELIDLLHRLISEGETLFTLLAILFFQKLKILIWFTLSNNWSISFSTPLYFKHASFNPQRFTFFSDFSPQSV